MTTQGEVTTRDEARMPPDTPQLRRIRASVIGDDQLMPGLYGPRRVTYADYTASGRALTFLEEFIREEVLPRYATTHTESSGTACRPPGSARTPARTSTTASAVTTRPQ